MRKVEAAIAAMDKGASEISLAVYGLAFKANIDDLRESPALKIAQQLATKYPKLLVFEPHIDTLPHGLETAELVDAAGAEVADVHLILVDHDAIKKLRFDGVVIDTRGVVAG